MAPLLLTIQTASPTGSVAITDGDQLLAEFTLDRHQRPAEWLLEGLDTILRKTAINKMDLDAVAVVCGPGSFTGLRVGIATAKGLASAAGCSLLGVSTLQCLAMQCPHVKIPVCVMLDARKQEVYSALYKWENSFPHLLLRERAVRPSELLEEIDTETLFIGSGVQLYKTLIIRQLANRAHFVPELLNVPRASVAASLAIEEWKKGNVCSAEELMPNYLRPSEAELNLRKKNQGNHIDKIV